MSGGAGPRERESFERAARVLQADVTAAAAMATNDAAVRRTYQQTVGALIAELRRDAEAGRLSWREAATRASETRNAVMDLLRGRSSPVGRALAEQLKAQGKTLNELIARYTVKLYGDRANFNALSAAQKDAVYGEIVKAAARTNPRVDARMAFASRAGRGLLVLSLAVSVYRVATSDEPGRAAAHEAAVIGGGVAGGVAGGALAGLACGPGAPVCVTIGAFVGGTVVALGLDLTLPW